MSQRRRYPGPILPGEIDFARPINYASPQASGLVAAWPGQLSAGTRTLRDPVGGYNGTLNGGVEWVNDAEMGPVLRFNGTGHVSVPMVPYLFPICVDVLFRTTMGGSGILMAWDDVNYNNMSKIGVYNGGPSGFARGSAGTSNVGTQAYTVNDGAWHHMRMVHATSSSQFLMLDGVLIKSDTGYVGSMSKLNALFLGKERYANSDKSFFVGDMAFPRIRYISDISTAFDSFDPQTRWDTLNTHSRPRSILVPGGVPSTTIYQRRRPGIIRVGSRAIAC